jgi:hypothetical protein
LNDLYVTLHFDAYTYFIEPQAIKPDIYGLIYNKPLEEDLLDFVTILNLDLNHSIPESVATIQKSIKEGLLKAFGIQEHHLRFSSWMQGILDTIETKLQSLKSDEEYCRLIISTTDAGIQLTFYPPWAPNPILNLRESDQRDFISHEEKLQPRFTASAAVASDFPSSSAHLVKRRDPSKDELGDPCDLHNYLLDSGATQHMTPRLADLENVVEGKKLGVEVADGHIIKCPATGKIKIQMLDDKGNLLEAKLHNVMYVPGLSRRLFSVTRFARHGHYAVFKNGTTSLHFAPSWATVTLTASKFAKAFATNASTTTSPQNVQYHAVPPFCNKDIPEQAKPIPLEL